MKNINFELNKMMFFGNKPIKGIVTNNNINRFNESINALIHGNEINETLNDKKSKKYHYKKHVLADNELRNSRNRYKYDNMSIDDYYNYAVYLSTLRPTFTIDKSLKNKIDIEDISNDFLESSSGSLKIDYDLKNKTDNHDMYAIFNMNSKYSKYMDLCLVDKQTNLPITLFPISTSKAVTIINNLM